MDALERMDISVLAEKRYRDLSGGQQQRVLIARALVRRPELLVLDEPTEGLDLPSEKQILDFISALNREQGITVILVAHKLSIILGRAKLAVLINKDTGVFIAGAVDEVLTDAQLTSLYGYPMHTIHREGGPLSVEAGPPAGEGGRVSFFENAFLWREAVIASMVLAAACAVTGAYTVLRRVVFLPAALSQISGLGVVLSFLTLSLFPSLAGAWFLNPFLWALVITLGAALVLGGLEEPRGSAGRR